MDELARHVELVALAFHLRTGRAAIPDSPAKLADNTKEP